MRRAVFVIAACLIGWSFRTPAEGQGAAITATYDTALKAPKCAGVGRSCTSGPSLLLGRDGKGPEPHQPNTLYGSCLDGTGGTFHLDESLDRLTVLTLDSTPLTTGKTAKVEATVWAWTTPSNDVLDLFYSASTSSPSWTLIGSVHPTVVGSQTLSLTYALPDSALQAVRAQFRYQSSANSCSAGDYNDRDDLVFAVQASPPLPDVVATYDSTFQTPRCTTLGRSCDSGPSLLLGRDSVGPEPNQPNTISHLCADGASGTFHVDESNDRIKVSTLDGTGLAAGKPVKVEATVWAWETPSSDVLDLYFTGDAKNPIWTLVGSQTPSAPGAQTLSLTYNLPAGATQAVRARYRFLGNSTPCGTGNFDDHDDLIFAVKP